MPFDLGDCVFLKSDRTIKMTIVGLDAGVVKCSWFKKDGTLKEHLFPSEALVDHDVLENGEIDFSNMSTEELRKIAWENK